MTDRPQWLVVFADHRPDEDDAPLIYFLGVGPIEAAMHQVAKLAEYAQDDVAATQAISWREQWDATTSVHREYGERYMPAILIETELGIWNVRPIETLT